MDSKHRDSFEIHYGGTGIQGQTGPILMGVGITFFGAIFSLGAIFVDTSTYDESGLLYFLTFFSIMFIAGLMYTLSWFHFIIGRQKLIVNKEGITIKAYRLWMKSVFIPLDTIDRVETLLYEKDGCFRMSYFFDDKSVPMIVAGIKRYPILLGASNKERGTGVTEINYFLRQHQRKPAKATQVFSNPSRMSEIEQSLPRPPHGSKIKTYIDENQNVVIGKEDKFSVYCSIGIAIILLFFGYWIATASPDDQLGAIIMFCVLGGFSISMFYYIGSMHDSLKLNPSGMTAIHKAVIYGSKKFYPITEIDSFELFQYATRSSGSRNGPVKMSSVTGLKINPWGDHIMTPAHVEEKRWLQQYLTEYFRIIRKNGMAQVVKVEKKVAKSDFKIIS